MTRLLILVEGQSEEAFVRDTLAPHLAGYGVYARPTVILTKRLSQGGGHRGGVANWSMIRENLLSLLGDKDAKVSTMLDFYGLPKDFPGKSVLSNANNAHAMVEALEKEFSAAIGNSRFIPFLTLFEFEALVFSSPKTIADHFALPALEQAAHGIVISAKSPELIDGGENTHPKKRLMRLLLEQNDSYAPASDGPTILKTIGIPVIRSVCQHFDAWVSQLESLGGSDHKTAQ